MIQVIKSATQMIRSSLELTDKEEADKISRLIRKFMAKYAFGETGIPSAKLNLLISKLESLIPSIVSETIKTEETEQAVQEKIENIVPEVIATDSSLKVKLEELKK